MQRLLHNAQAGIPQLREVVSKERLQRIGVGSVCPEIDERLMGIDAAPLILRRLLSGILNQVFRQDKRSLISPAHRSQALIVHNRVVDAAIHEILIFKISLARQR